MTDQPQIPDRSLWRIMRICYDIDGRHSDLARDVLFSVRHTPKGGNQTEVRIRTMHLDGVQTDEEVTIIYRNGLFCRAIICQDDEELRVYRLSEVINHLDRSPTHV